ncbi:MULTISPECIES: lytic transglycosylase domain-containing protein [Burkholderia cepacia complex]|uniref:lytic transglycosylase domain-containing protein n=1 Tax=Burkholderia cepacia complex TaxID=87882 RepID=UPI001CF20C66|nr:MULTISPECIES: lytic transglycosylase domain-containing protein [Burkholderia cepacia complex]MCA8057153.1 lytic transglycosylase domain-containing protein [Burkholderia cepacia]MDN7534657.1 lytic transglycosylase domain-containing protein [Burkholderia orbicola]
MKRVWRIPFCTLLVVVTQTVRADCLDDAARFHHVNVRLVRAIATVESGQRASVVHLNGDGTTDIGLMQINSRWLTTLSRFGVSRAGLYERCTNAYVGAWILSQNIRSLGLTWDAIGAYNAGAHEKRIAYARRVYRELHVLPATVSELPEVVEARPAKPDFIARLFEPIGWGNGQ